MSEQEVVVSLDGLPRPASVVRRDGGQVLVRFRQGGDFEERWVPAADVLEVEPTPRLPKAKVIGLGVLGVLGLVLVLWPGGSNKPLVSSDATPTPTASPSAVPTGAAPSPLPSSTTALLFGDSFAAGRGSPSGTPTALEVAARALGWRSAVRAQQGTGFTTSPSYGERLAREVTLAPDVLLLEGGASDTDASTEQLTRAAVSVVRSLRTRFPDTHIVLMGPVAMERPTDQGLVRVGRALKAVAAAEHVDYVDPLPWITADNAQAYLSTGGFYPNAKGHAYLGARLATSLRALKPAD